MDTYPGPGGVSRNLLRTILTQWPPSLFETRGISLLGLVVVTLHPTYVNLRYVTRLRSLMTLVGLKMTTNRQWVKDTEAGIGA